ncbi:MAG: hypothetical protein WDN45_12360 [Caulobacteraceae bacterium]
MHQDVMFKPALRALFMALCLALPLAACAWDGLTARQDADLRAVYEKMRVNDISGIEAAFDPQFRTAPLHQNLSFMQGMIPPQASAGRLLKGLILKDKGHTDYGGLYEYDYSVHRGAGPDRDAGGPRGPQDGDRRASAAGGGGHRQELRLRPDREEALPVRLPVPGGPVAPAGDLGPDRPGPRAGTSSGSSSGAWP